MRQKTIAILITAITVLIIGEAGYGQCALAAGYDVAAKVRDKASGIDITDALYRIILLPDSTTAVSGETVTKWLTGSSDNWTEHREAGFTARNLDSDNDYVLEITADGYEPLYLAIDPSGLGKRESVLNLGYLELKRAQRLDELTVTATKVKFYNKGDTIIYNADAFQLAEGSMLDALIAQLPGAELKDNGQILVNGRPVESLLLNSKDFFKGDNKIMLDNLGAYTVKNIAVYDGQKDEDRIMGTNYGKKRLTMDVRLKKEYNRGLIFNAEAGYGLKDRFLGRLFGLRYDDRGRVGFYGNANNISSLRQPNEKATSARPAATAQETTVYSGGVDYALSVPRSPMSFAGNASVTYTKTKEDAGTYTTNFLPDGDTYGYSFGNGMRKSLDIKTEHTAKADADSWNWEMTPRFRYVRNSAESSLISATFGREWDDIDRSFLEGIHMGDADQALSSMINRNARDEDRHGHKVSFDVETEGKKKVNRTDALTYGASYSYEGKREARDELIRLNYDDNPEPALNDRRHFDVNPDLNWRAKGRVGYILAVTRNLFAEVSYTYRRRYSHTVSELYRQEGYLRELAEGGLGNLAPSAREGQGVLDGGNSFDSRYDEETHDVGLEFNYNIKGVSVWAELPISVRRQWLRYERGDVDARLHRTRLYPGDFSLSANIHCNEARPIWIYIGYDRKVTSPDMVDMVDFTDDLDPLKVRKGNPDLKDASSENIRVYYDQRLDRKRNMKQGYGIDCTLYSNSLAYGYSYDRNTGVKTGRMYNVAGNASYSGYQSFNADFGRMNRMSIGNRTTFAYRRSADMLSEDASSPARNVVDTYGIGENISLSYSRSAFRLTGQANVNWRRFTGRQEGFEPFNAWDMRYTLSGNLRLPAGFSLNTDFNIYARRGYTEASLNKNNYVWNARLSYSMMKGNLLLMLDGFDILHNLSNVSYTVNAQARTETYAGVVPRYLMLRIQWKFNKAPLKR